MSSAKAKSYRRRGTIAAVIVVLIGSMAIWGMSRFHKTPEIPTAVVKRSRYVDWLQLRGQVKALESVPIMAPTSADNLQILKLVPSGTPVKKGDVVVQFDATKLEQSLAQDRVAVQSAKAKIEESRAKAQLKEQQDVTDVMKARFAVQSDELDASKSEIVSAIEGGEAKLKLADARQKLSEAQTKLESDQASDAADVESNRQALAKALYLVRQAQQEIGQLTIRAPIPGIVTLLETNWRSGGPMGNPVAFKPGDRVWSGVTIAELPDLTTLEIAARVDETERGRLRVGQKITVRVGAIPDREFQGRVTAISSLASTDFAGGWPFRRNFTVELTLDRLDKRLRPGMAGTVRVAVNSVPNGIVIPEQALFRKGGQNVVYLLRGSKFEAQGIEVASESNNEALISKGVEPGERVALKDPTLTR